MSSAEKRIEEFVRALMKSEEVLVNKRISWMLGEKYNISISEEKVEEMLVDIAEIMDDSILGLLYKAGVSAKKGS